MTGKQREHCGSCRHEYLGTCRRRAPVLVAAMVDGPGNADDFRAVWPEVDEDDLCSEFEVDDG